MLRPLNITQGGFTMGFSLKQALEADGQTIDQAVSPSQTESLEDAITNNGFETVNSFLVRNANKTENAKILDIVSQSIPVDKYVFYLTNEEVNANIVQISRANELAVLANTSCDKVTVHTNGVSCNSTLNRTYIMGSQVIQYILDANQFPVARIMFGRPSKSKLPEVKVTKGTEKYKDMTEQDRLEMIMVVVQSNAAKSLEKRIKEVKTVMEIKQEMLNFIQSKKDPLYRIKVEDILLDL